MPTMKELKAMLKKVEADGEAAIEELFEGKPEASEPVVPEEPVFVSERPFGLVDGIAGVKYQQDGEYFDSQRKFVRKA